MSLSTASRMIAARAITRRAPVQQQRRGIVDYLTNYPDKVSFRTQPRFYTSNSFTCFRIKTNTSVLSGGCFQMIGIVWMYSNSVLRKNATHFPGQRNQKDSMQRGNAARRGQPNVVEAIFRQDGSWIRVCGRWNGTFPSGKWIL